MATDRVWLENAFWETPKKEILNAISERIDQNGKSIRQVYKLMKYNSDGSENADFKEAVEFLGTDKIDESTQDRLARKSAEADLDKQKKLEHERAKKLERLFEYKLETFEIPEIKDSKNRQLKSRLRRSRSIPEVNLYAMMIIQDAIANEQAAATE